MFPRRAILPFTFNLVSVMLRRNKTVCAVQSITQNELRSCSVGVTDGTGLGDGLRPNDTHTKLQEY
jgi:hypothetical protein